MFNNYYFEGAPNIYDCQKAYAQSAENFSISLIMKSEILFSFDLLLYCFCVGILLCENPSSCYKHTKLFSGVIYGRLDLFNRFNQA